MHLAHGTPAATAGVWRVRAGGETRILKLLRGDAEGNRRWPAQPRPADPYYWRREACAYESGLTERLPGPLRGPRCHACVERADGTVALWLEDVALPPAATWGLDRYGEAARHLGLAQGALAHTPPTDEWLSRRWLRAYLELREDVIAAHGSGPTRALWERREEILQRLERVPQTLCHLDLYPANLFGDENETVLVDWAFCGLGAVGEDAGNLVPDSLLDEFVPPGRAEELEHVVWDGYLRGLREAGWKGDEEELRFAFIATAGLKYPWIPAFLALGEGREGWRAVLPFLDRMAEEALRLASGT